MCLELMVVCLDVVVSIFWRTTTSGVVLGFVVNVFLVLVVAINSWIGLRLSV
ncbi:MAG: hypothetical protein ACUVUF_00615 [Candidatus Bathycorpusculaceae bacterium]